ncbi:hypothetical protein [Nocardia inohanensis]|uniref:hypothetical protein n=1 Tax=Nocardia inohanensis TaxID=209246 RepID=UPI00082ABB1D|nr:hypothetical protein [Nocardia inohanensis]
MGRNLAVCGAAVLAALAISACTRHGSAAPGVGGETTPPPATTATTEPPVTTPASDLPECGTPGAAEPPPSCVLTSRDSLGLSFEVRYTGSKAQGYSATITVLDSGGDQLQTIVEKDARSPSQPILRDLDGDNRDELIVPVYLATANSRSVIYHAGGDTQHFQRAGEVAGIGIDRSESGYLTVWGRGSAKTFYVDFLTFSGDSLKPVVTAEVELFGSAGHVTGSQCTVKDSGGLSGSGLTLEQAREHFCAEPAVLSLMR